MKISIVEANNDYLAVRINKLLLFDINDKYQEKELLKINPGIGNTQSVYIKIQDDNQFCSHRIIPYVRGR